MSITRVTSRVLADNSVGTAQLSAGAVTTKLGSEIGAFNFRNKIINGNFDIWQRGASFTGPEYGADRWLNNRFGSGCKMSREAFTLGQTDVPNEPTYFCRMAVNSLPAAGNASTLRQRIEDVRTFAGSTVTATFYAKANANKTVAVEFAQLFGTGGSPSAAVTAIGVQKLSLTTAWQKFTVTANIPSISGKTLGTNNDHYLQIDIWLDAGSNFNSRTDTLGHQSGTFNIAQVQVEAGSVATPFEQRPIGLELSLCQRYALALTTGAPSSTETIGHGYNANGAFHRVLINCPVPLRRSPTLIFTSGSINDLITDIAGLPSVGNFTVENFQPRCFNLLRSASTALQPNSTIYGSGYFSSGHLRVNGVSNVRFIADAEL
jgi:hypothetical protein